ncbi:class I SAM-dependent methyltransferase [Rickettsiella endosymbiont of Aleochara curtula]|uniref:class I SAM-dependent methyltransferase n=1 Tax=Rickettsiella endosymbiont of Aleochara curtula TaxID=3077936 RepID=UPI00313C57C8
MELAFQLPPLVQNGPYPIWTGHDFQLGDERTKILHYNTNYAGWNDELNSFHEDAFENHFLNKLSRDYTIHQLKTYLAPLTKPAILEIGCSSGYMLQQLSQLFPYATIIGSDVVYKPLLELSKRLALPLLRFDILQCPLPDNCIDAIIILNVLEHIEDDVTTLKQIYRILKPNGVLILEVPAGPHLYDAHDKICMHFRRYKLSKLCQLITKQGFKVISRSHLGTLIYPAFFLAKLWNKRLLSKPDSEQRQLMEKKIRQTSKNKLLSILMNIELKLGKWIAYPFGIRCVVSCIKPTVVS